MKKYLFFLSMLSMLLLTACSSEDDIATAPELTQEEKDAIIAEAGQNSDVPIRLGMGSLSTSTTVTRAPLEPLPTESDGLFETPTGKYLGIYCLAQKPQLAVNSIGPVAVSDIKWNSGKSTLHYLLEHNQPAKVELMNAGSSIDNIVLTQKSSVIKLLDPNTLNNNTPTVVDAYYPFGNWYNYYFYAYYPRQDTGSIVDEKKVTVNFEINGTEDILWSKKAKPIDVAQVDSGFNAKYMRKHQTNASDIYEHLPKFELEHKLTQLRFWVKCSWATHETYGYGSDVGDKLLQIEDLKVSGVPVNWTLTVADRDHEENEGKLTQTDTTTEDLPIWQMTVNNAGEVTAFSDSYVFNQANPSSTRKHIPYVPDGSADKPLGLGYAMIPTTAMLNNAAPTITFTIYYGATKTVNGDDGKGQTWVSENMTISVPTGGFLEGNVYNVILNIPPPEGIDMHATLDVWEVVPTNIDMTIE